MLQTIRPFLALSTFAVVIALCGCPEEDPNLDEGASAYCEETATVVALDELTDLGFTAQEVIDALVFTHETDLDFTDGGSAALTIDLLFDGGEVRYVDSVAVYPEGDEEMAAGAILCEAYVEIDVTVDFVTDDGVFDESWELPLQATAADAASFGLSDLTPDDFTGTYDFMAFDPAEHDGVTTSVWAAFDMGGPRGEISEMATSESQDEGGEGVASAENQTVASWDGEDLL
jgi:hypothetical protein